ncbi:MAG: hypothetical protein HDKAJFGB_02480 [Anaerolineae bacterium]|nr:hypothetical protein [Anaerolineae bacterium]
MTADTRGGHILRFGANDQIVAGWGLPRNRTRSMNFSRHRA